MVTRRSATQRDYRERIFRVLLHIQAHLDEPLDLERLATLAHFSPFHFHRVFTGMVGEPVRTHVRRLRLERAAQQIKLSRGSLLEIALDAGYESHEAFSRAFKRQFGCSPSGFRESLRRRAPSGVHFSEDPANLTFHPLYPEHAAMDLRTEQLQPRTIVYLRHTGPYEQVGALWGQLLGWVGQNNLFGPNTESFGICYDDPEVTPPDKLRYEACVTVPEGQEVSAPMLTRRHEGGRYAVVTHKGSYSKLSETYHQLVGQAMPAQDLEPVLGQPSLEFYRNMPHDTPEEDLITEIWWPIR